MKILYASSEIHPLIKAGGLGDVGGSLPKALKNQHIDIRLIMPFYQDALVHTAGFEVVSTLKISHFDEPIRLWEGRLPGSPIKMWLVEAPSLFQRPGGPYGDTQGNEWPDNPQRFAIFSKVVVEVALNRAQVNWQPDLVHCNDWQTGLVPALLHFEQSRPACLFTIHNLAYQGLCSQTVFQSLHLPPQLWAIEAMEFYGKFSLLKGGIVFADRVNTVSPNYAREITTPEFGCGLETLLQQRGGNLEGILNGADYQVWDPRHDVFITKTYNSKTIKDKIINKTALQEYFGLPQNENTLLFGSVGRLVHQKGIDLLVKAIPQIISQDVQFIILGSGQKEDGQILTELSHQYPQKIKIHLGYHESLAHKIEAGADAFVMPSRFEPCGLNQLYSLRYGAIPIIHAVGGLADTVVDANENNLNDHTATGIVFHQASADSLSAALLRCWRLFQDTKTWRKLIQNAMRQDFSWKQSAKAYIQLYEKTLAKEKTANGEEIGVEVHVN